ncbi:RGCVC family protein [Blastococcus montanus]|uniref:RGCVC family protein n=1 Tax=Blastococcus montanus TaxID=3144973 RepID=UPI003207E9FC
MISAPPRPARHVQSVAEGACPACPHALDAHDRISLRYCRASAGHATTRGCVCPRA